MLPRPRWAPSALPRIPAPLAPRFARRAFQSTAEKDPPPLVSLEDAALPGGSSLSWTMHNRGADELWALVGPASEEGGRVRDAVCNLVLAKARPRTAGGDLIRSPTHPFLGTGTPRPGEIAFVSFGARAPDSNGEFFDYASRYGSIREEERETLFETLMESLGADVGGVAARKLRPDALAPAEHVAGRFRWRSEAEREAAVRHAQDAQQRIRSTAPLLGIDDALLQRPRIALSNGQSRRARILQALVSGARLVVLEEPFTGLDVPTRREMAQLFSRLHSQRTPHVCLVLREQDGMPPGVTHVLRVHEDGSVVHGPIGEVPDARPGAAPAYPPGSYDRVAQNAKRGVGAGHADADPVAEMHDVTITYGDTAVLQHASLVLRPGTRLVLAGENGSGKTTLLSLILGDNPRSYAMPASQLRLWGQPRDAPTNAVTLLHRRVGHVAPEVVQAFPRKSLERGGLTVLEAIASGYDGIFTRRPRSPAQTERAMTLLRQFADVLQAHQDTLPLDVLAGTAFNALSHGSQAVVLLLRALVHRPRLLVLDEAFQGMSARQSARTREFLDGGVDGEAHDAWWLDGMSDTEREAELAWRRNLAMVVISHFEAEWSLTCGAYLRLQGGKSVEQW